MLRCFARSNHTRFKRCVYQAGLHLRTPDRSRSIFTEGDLVLLRPRGAPSSDGKLSKPLERSGTHHTHNGVIQHGDILGKSARDLVVTNRGSEYRLYKPTLAEYTRLSSRIVTPIYPADASLITSLLDIHVDPWESDGDQSPRLQVLEIGTGHGALTLHLSRAIHGANAPIPPMDVTLDLSKEPSQLGSEIGSGAAVEDSVSVQDVAGSSNASPGESWKASRRAIVDTLDISAKHSKHAEKVLTQFRRGQYRGNVDFHVTDLSSFLSQRESDGQWISHCVIDVPSSETLLEKLSMALQIDAPLVVFNPSITQIGECIKEIKEKRLPLALEKVVEIGPGAGTGGREWDVRYVTPRSRLRFKNDVEPTTQSGEMETPVTEAVPKAHEVFENEGVVSDQEQRGHSPVMVCRPKVGGLVVGGGFLGVWRRLKEDGKPED